MQTRRKSKEKKEEEKRKKHAADSDGARRFEEQLATMQQTEEGLKKLRRVEALLRVRFEPVLQYAQKAKAKVSSLSPLVPPVNFVQRITAFCASDRREADELAERGEGGGDGALDVVLLAEAALDRRAQPESECCPAPEVLTASVKH
eukprot:1629593-Rhodomonas_salina.1